MSEEKELIKKRGSYKGRVTAFSTFLNGLDISSLTSTDVSELQIRIGKIKSIFELYDEVQLRIECLSDNLDHIAERDEFESTYYRLLARAQDIVNNYSAANEMKNVSSASSTHKLVKLPTIKLPTFSGSYENWLEFHDTFSSLIHTNTEIEDINKFHYLRTSLQGSAAVVIQSIQFCAKNYEAAWKLLCDRFDSKRLLIHNHVSSLFNLELLTKESSVSLKRLIDNFNKNLLALESLGEPVKHWDTLLIYIISKKLDSRTFREWEEHKDRLDKKEIITFECFNSFLRNRADLLETIELSRSSNQTHCDSPNKQTAKHKTMVSAQNNSHPPVKLCPMCKSYDHSLASCSQFLSLNNESRFKLMPSFKVCFNCFSSGHFANRCKRQGCKVCKRKHNTIIHVSNMASKPNAVDSSEPTQTSDIHILPNNNNSTASTSASQPNLTLSASVERAQPGRSSDASVIHSARCEILLSTALVKLYDANNCEHIARAVLDSGSTSCLITESMFKKLSLPMICIDESILGINNGLTQVHNMCKLHMKSLNEQYTSNIRCFILPTITDCVPSGSLDLTNINIPSDIVLADPKFYSPGEVDILIGADIFWDILGTQKLRLGSNKPILFDSKLGWLVAGPVNSYKSEPSNHIKCNLLHNDSSAFSNCDDIQTQLSRFWQLEEISPKSSSHFSREEQLCEEHFVKNTIRLKDGRYCVRIPLKESSNVLGGSYQRAKHCFLSLERRNKSKPVLDKLYKEFMLDYYSLGHMSECAVLDTEKHHFIPHHGILREGSTTTKLRAVFNASSPTTSGISLNDIQMVGPQTQSDLLSILIRYRQHRYVLAGDVEKMYRQVMVHPDDRHLQNILWRFNASDQLKVFQLNTVTYGTSSAPFLATRCLKQIGLDCSDPKIAEIIINDFYVDDLLTGGTNINEVLAIREKVTNSLAAAGMPLRKWKSNDPQLTIGCTQPSFDLNIGAAEPSKTLGLGWLTASDELCFPIGNDIAVHKSKRGILSVIAQIFDPLGLLAPCVIRMKILLQRLWLEKLSWDDQLSPEVCALWSDIISSLPLLNHIRIPRHVICDNSQLIDLHIFTDASERAYGGCVYIRSVGSDNDCLVRLLFAKSRVAPIKPTTIPRLELCGALVGVRLYEKAVSSLRLKINNVVFWTDSTVVLGWLKMLPSKLQPFVRNRVAEILETSHNYSWRHVPTDVNPADYLTRGVDFKLMHSLDIWWSGPAFLKQDECHWPVNSQIKEKLPEIRHISLQASSSAEVSTQTQGLLIDFHRFSNLSRLKRSVAFVLRFVNRCKGLSITENYLTAIELTNALTIIIKFSQKESFAEYNLLLNKQPLPKKSPLLKFNIFLDEHNVMRVGGRLSNADFNYDKKFPILIQSKHRFTQLLFNCEHLKLMHAGPQLLLANIRERYWPIGGRNLAKSCYRTCIRCSRIKGQVIAPQMGNLPHDRLKPGYPFRNVGVDYAGPMMAVSRQGRGSRTVKVYIAVFICFATKAIHLELVGDLTSHSYIYALHRFVSRRGKPQNVYSDNGTSFVGAYNELSKFLKTNCDSLAEGVANEGINFHFIPAYAPHFGGLWEAGVKSTKYHLVRVLGNCHLTYEELNTALAQIEAILNSRPLTPISSDPEDLTPITPGHFLIGRPLTALPDKGYEDCSYNHLRRFQRIQQLRETFWKRWSKEYVVELQQRTKWRTNSEPLKLNSLVVIKEDNLPPLKWRLGRIVAVHPGSDGINRVADVKTSSGIVRRAFSKICPLPVQDGSV